MSFPRDDARLDRVRALMAERDLDALVVRTPDNIVYLTNFWGMKGYDACVFPREGEPVLICLEASEADAARTAWTSDVRLFPGYDPDDPRPPSLRALELAAAAARDYDRVAIELSGGTQASDRMVGEPTTFAQGLVRRLPRRARRHRRCSSGRAPSRRPRRSSGWCSRTRSPRRRWSTCATLIRPGMTSAQAAAIWQAFVHGEGTGWRGEVDLALPVLAGLVGPVDQDVHGDLVRARASRASRRCSRSGSAPTATGPTTRRTWSAAS